MLLQTADFKLTKRTKKVSNVDDGEKPNIRALHAQQQNDGEINKEDRTMM